MKRMLTSLAVGGVAGLGLVVACGNSGKSDGSGGATASGGSTSATGGTGNVGTGGTATGGTGNVGTGGTATGGTGNTGGTGTGGAGNTGGTGATGGGGNACLGSPPPPLTLREVASGFASPMWLTTPPDDASLFYVAEREGRIQVYDGTNTSTFLNIVSNVSDSGERGLLSFALHPQFDGTSERRVFVFYNRRADGATVVSSFNATSRTAADPAETVLLTVSQPASNHNGGTIAFGPDGFLYVGLGDGGGSNDQFNQGQTRSSQLGSMLRVDVDAYPTPPAGNMPGAHPDVIHIGLRNPFRFTFDREAGDLYVGDVGQNRWEEVSVLPASAGPSNFGWPIMEASECFGSRNCDQNGLLLPIAEYRNPNVGKSVIGGYVYRGSAIPELVGRYFYADWDSKRFWTLVWDGSSACDEHEITNALNPGGNLSGIPAFGEDANGELYVIEIAGTIYRIERG